MVGWLIRWVGGWVVVFVVGLGVWGSFFLWGVMYAAFFDRGVGEGGGVGVSFHLPTLFE